MYECIVKTPAKNGGKGGSDETQYLMLLPKNEQENRMQNEEMPFEQWTNQIRVNVKIILSFDKHYTV